MIAARYVLCTLIDEAAAGTPWGGAGAWGRHSLLAMFHNETGGGEKVFQLMARLAENAGRQPRPARADLRRAVRSASRAATASSTAAAAQLEAVRDRLAQILKKERGDYAHALAQHWRGTRRARRSRADAGCRCG